MPPFLYILAIVLLSTIEIVSTEIRIVDARINRPLSEETIKALKNYQSAQTDFQEALIKYQNINRAFPYTKMNNDIITYFNQARQELNQAYHALLATDPTNIQIDPYGSIIKKFYTSNGSSRWVPIQEYEQLRQASSKKKSTWFTWHLFR